MLLPVDKAVNDINFVYKFLDKFVLAGPIQHKKRGYNDEQYQQQPFRAGHVGFH
jgi:hypothetical protein